MFVSYGDCILNLDYIESISVGKASDGTYSLRFWTENGDNDWYALGEYEDELEAYEAHGMLINKMKENPSLIEIQKLVKELEEE